MLRRKMESILREWKQTPDHNPLIIKGCRQCGKTSSVLAFGKANYERLVYLNFIEDPTYASIFSGSLNIDHLVMLITSLLGPDALFIPGKTLLVLDEIQECPEARTSLKFFKCDGRYDVIGTGSLLGIQGYRENLRSIPVGYETVVEMHPMDFEEFLWANGMQDTAVDILRDCLEKEVPVPDALHKKMISLMLAYTVVGGMPNVVNTFVQSKNLALVLKMQRDIVSAYQDDMVKYADRSMKGKIRECFQSIPSQLSKENKKFQYNLIRKGSKASQYESSLQWLEDAGIICRCYNLNLPELPLDGNAVTNVFKVYMHDTGLFVSMLEDGTQYDILQGNLLGYKGAIFENLLADIFSKMERKLYYLKKDSGLEIDFVIRHQGQAKLIECKSTTGNAKSMKSVLGNPEKYHVEQGIKLGLYQIGRSGPILTLPLYMAFLLHQV